MAENRDKMDDKILHEITQAKIQWRTPKTDDLGSVCMYLPLENRMKWKETIEKDPILKK